MILLTHILLAVVSTVYALHCAFSPSKIKLRNTYLLTFGTITSGIVMTIFSPHLLGQTCITGVVYLAFIISVSWVARKRLAIIA